MDSPALQSTAPGATQPQARFPASFSVFAWALLGYLLLVILFGAWVRITGSGAGCGSHWPTCHGEVIPRSPTTETIIEFTHRLTSGLLGIASGALVVWSFVAQLSKPVKVACVVTLWFVILEALIGAGIVLKELVGSDDSAARATVIAIHLLSTFSLTASTGLVAWWSSARPAPRWGQAPRAKWGLAGALAAVIVVSMTGAVTALGDTLFPVSPTSEFGFFARLTDDLAPAAHFLVRLRIVHPILAVLVAAGLMALPTYLAGISHRTERLLAGLRHAVLVQLALGCANIVLGAPGWMQLLHLLGAQLVWLLLVFAVADTAGTRALVTRPSVGP